MGLSSKQVSIDGFDWTKALLPITGTKRSEPAPPVTLIHQPEQLKCPRCDSTNTKFCYYNNYNKSQPRHFCRACKRHWTKGGTLRNVPVGGGRKNKRLKKSPATAAAGTPNPLDRSSKQNLSDILYQGLVFPASSFNDSGEWPERDFNGNNNLNGNKNINFSAVSSSTSYDTKQSPISSSFYSDQDLKTFTSTLPWQLPSTSADVAGFYWSSWDEIDPFVGTDVNVSWDDEEIKP